MGVRIYPELEARGVACNARFLGFGWWTVLLYKVIELVDRFDYWCSLKLNWLPFGLQVGEFGYNLRKFFPKVDALSDLELFGWGKPQSRYTINLMNEIDQEYCRDKRKVNMILFMEGIELSDRQKEMLKGIFWG